MLLVNQSNEIKKKLADVSISEKIQNFDDFSGLYSPEFDSLLRDLAVWRVGPGRPSDQSDAIVAGYLYM